MTPSDEVVKLFESLMPGLTEAQDRKLKWDLRYLELAQLVSTWSKDPSTQTGAVIVDGDNHIVSVGFNGFPKYVKDDLRLFDREKKYEMIVHCEVNAILFAKRDLQYATLYTYPFMSCSRCAGVVIQSGIRRVVAPINDNPRWKANFELSTGIFNEAQVEIVLLPWLDKVD